MGSLDILLSGLLVVAAFSALRELEIWLHRHIFKVGWLLTQNFQTTTILYYTFFLPGLFVNQVLIWLVAGMLDVRAERAVSWPEKQEIGSLRLDFVRVSKKVGRVRKTVIEIAPLIGGIFLVWLIANSILNVGDAFSVMEDGTLTNLGEAINRLTSQPAFWLWVYFAFTITNAMMPDPKVLQGWTWGIAIFTGIVGFLFLAGFGNDAINAGFFEPIINGLNGLTGVFGLMIILDLIAVAFLGLIESTIEWLTGHSATFEKGKMVTMTRQEAIEKRRAARKQSKPAAMRASSTSGQIPALAGQPSIYKFEFPTPGAPGREPVSQSASGIVEPDEPATQQPSFFERERPKRMQPDIITGSVARSDKDQTPDPPESVEGTPRTSPLARTGGPIIRSPSSFRQQDGDNTEENDEKASEDPTPTPAAVIPSATGSKSAPDRSTKLNTAGADDDEKPDTSEKTADHPARPANAPGAKRSPTRPAASSLSQRLGGITNRTSAKNPTDDSERSKPAVPARPALSPRPPSGIPSTKPGLGMSDDDDEDLDAELLDEDEMFEDDFEDDDEDLDYEDFEDPA